MTGMQKCSLQDTNVFSFWITDRMRKRATTQNLNVRKQTCGLQKTLGWDGSLIILRQPRKYFAQAAREDHMLPNKVGTYISKMWPGWGWKEVWGQIVDYMTISTLNGSKVIWQGRRARGLGLLVTPEGLVKTLIRQLGNVWWIHSCHWQFWLTHQPEGNCDLLSVQQEGQELECQ